MHDHRDDATEDFGSRGGDGAPESRGDSTARYDYEVSLNRPIPQRHVEGLEAVLRELRGAERGEVN